MSYDVRRTLKYGAIAGGVAYFGSSLVEKVVSSSPIISDDRYRVAGTAAVTAVLTDAAMQVFLK